MISDQLRIYVERKFAHDMHSAKTFCWLSRSVAKTSFSWVRTVTANPGKSWL